MDINLKNYENKNRDGSSRSRSTKTTATSTGGNECFQRNKLDKKVNRMVKKVDWIELVFVVICLIFAIAISFYHMSYDGYLGINNDQWDTIWAISENALSLSMCVLIFLIAYGVLRVLFKWVFMPYFILKLIYHVSCYAKIYLCSENRWENIWSFVCVILIMIGLLFTIILIRRRVYVA